MSDAFLSGVISRVSAGAFARTGEILKNKFGEKITAEFLAVKMLAHGTVGGITSVLQGGKFGHGFASAAATAGATSFNNSDEYIDKNSNGISWRRVAAGAAIGGSVSKQSGGKFANGAMTGAFSQALNGELSEKDKFQSSIEEKMAAVQAKQVFDFDLMVGEEQKIARLATMGVAANKDGIEYSLTVDGKVVSAGVAYHSDGVVTVTVSKGISAWKDIVAANAGVGKNMVDNGFE